MVLAGVVVTTGGVVVGVVVIGLVVVTVVVCVGVVVVGFTVTADVVVVAPDPQPVSKAKNVAAITMNKNTFFNIFPSLFPEDNRLFLYSLFIVYDYLFGSQ
jgi:hypothetical protein